MSVDTNRKGGGIALFIGTLSGNLFLLFGTLVLATTALLIGWIPPRGHLVYWVARVWSRGVLLASGVRVDKHFQEPIDPRARLVFMSNHQSLFDIPLLIATLPGQTRFLAKRSLFRIPIFGWALKLGGFITIDRDDRSSARASFKAAVERLQDGVSILVFPEGTRSWDGELQQFKRGGFLLALKSGLPIVPVGIRGTLGVQRRRSLRIRPGRVTVHYGRPIPVSGRLLRERPALEAEVRREIARLADRRDG